MDQPDCDLNGAVDAWLQAYVEYRGYLRATEALYVAFAHKWPGSRRSLTEAFAAFRESLVNEGGYKHLDVIEIYPNSDPHSK